MSLRDDLLPVADLGGKLAKQFGLSRYAVTIRVRRWNGEVGDESAGFIDTTLVLDPPPDVSLMSPFAAQMSGVIMAAGTVEDRYFKLDGITPAYAGGGYTPAQLVPMAPDDRTEVTYLLTGDDGVPLECNLAVKDFSDPFAYQLIVREKRRRTEQNAP